MSKHEILIKAKEVLYTSDKIHEVGLPHKCLSFRVRRIYICHAIDSVSFGREGKELQLEVLRRLKPHATVNSYVRFKIKPKLKGNVLERAIQDFRHLWLDALIKEFEGK